MDGGGDFGFVHRVHLGEVEDVPAVLAASSQQSASFSVMPAAMTKSRSLDAGFCSVGCFWADGSWAEVWDVVSVPAREKAEG